jgi:hypothetical protein
MNPIYDELLHTWCESILKLQVTHIESKGIHGGILCPACAKMHGRSGDAVYPLMYMAHKTGESRYLDAAIKLQDWSEHFSSPDGSWVNESENSWKGITVFGTIALSDAIKHHGLLLDHALLERWKLRLRKAAEAISRFQPVISIIQSQLRWHLLWPVRSWMTRGSLREGRQS